MPKSRVRKKSDRPVRAQVVAPTARGMQPSPTWYPIVMAVVLLVGLAWIVVYYLAGDRVPVMQSIGGWNFAVGFGVMIIGLAMAVRWR